MKNENIALRDTRAERRPTKAIGTFFIQSMYKIRAFLAAMFCNGLATAPSQAAESACTPDVTWPDVPAAIRRQIDHAVGEAVSPQGGPFNSTDVMDSRPNARFFGACHTAEQWTVALERGGIAYYLQVFRFSEVF